ncbi:hypothetical protein ASD99_01325 [Mesorhizobium sp. Root695]|nr:hypothetical protein ASD99_01325 [Mesorhizobium sp. Root695]
MVSEILRSPAWDAAPQHDDAIRNREDVLQIVRDEDHAAPLRLELVDERNHLALLGTPSAAVGSSMIRTCASQ